ADPDLHRYARRLSRYRCRGARPERGHCPQPDRDVEAQGADHRDGGGRGWLRWCPGARGMCPLADAAMQHLIGGPTGGLRLDALGIVDEIIQAPLGGAHRDHDQAALRVRDSLAKALAKLRELPLDQLVDRRYERLLSYANVTRKPRDE